METNDINVVAEAALKQFHRTQDLNADDETDLVRVNTLIASQPDFASDNRVVGFETGSGSMGGLSSNVGMDTDLVLEELAKYNTDGYFLSITGKPYRGGWVEIKAASSTATFTIAHTSQGDLNDDLRLAFKSMLKKNSFPESWRRMGIQQPNNTSQQRTFDLATEIFQKYKMFPHRIAPSIEEGVMLVYLDRANSRTLNFEIYNNNEVVGLVNRENKIELCTEITNNQQFQELVDKFKE